MPFKFHYLFVLQLYISCVTSFKRDTTPNVTPSQTTPSDDLDLDLDYALLPDFHEPCNKTDCAPGLFCTEDICQCANPSYEVYNNLTGRCDRVVGAICTAQSICMPGALCIRNIFEKIYSSSGVFGPKVVPIIANICQCPAGWVDNMWGGCDLAHGHPCGGEFEDAKCDRHAELVCREDKCACPDASDKYNSKERRCMKGVGTPCRWRGQCSPSADCVWDTTRTPKNLWGTCLCSFKDDPCPS